MILTRTHPMGAAGNAAPSRDPKQGLLSPIFERPPREHKIQTLGEKTAMLLTTRQVAELLQVSERQVRELVNPRLRNGDPRPNPMPVCKLSERVLRFNREAVLAWATLQKE